MYAQYNICQIWYVICIICTWYVLTHKMNTFLGNLGSTYLFLYIVSWPKSTKTTRMRPKRASMTLYNSKYILITKEFRLIELWFLIIRKRAWVFCSIQGEFRGWTVPNRIKVSLSGQNCCGRRGGFTFFWRANFGCTKTARKMGVYNSHIFHCLNETKKFFFAKTYFLVFLVETVFFANFRYKSTRVLSYQ